MGRKERILSSLVVVAAATAGLVFCLKQIKPTQLPVHPYTFPAIILGIMDVLGIIRLVQGFLIRPEGGAGKSSRLSWKCLATAVLIGLFAWAMKPIGYVISSFIYIIAQMLVLWEGKKRWWLMFVIAFFGSVVIYLMFRNLFNVMLPQGILKF